MVTDDAVKTAIAARYGIFPMIAGNFSSKWGVKNIESDTWVCRYKTYGGAQAFLDSFLDTYYAGLGL